MMRQRWHHGIYCRPVDSLLLCCMCAEAERPSVLCVVAVHVVGVVADAGADDEYGGDDDDDDVYVAVL